MRKSLAFLIGILSSVTAFVAEPAFAKPRPVLRYAADAGVVRTPDGVVSRWDNSGSVGVGVGLRTKGVVRYDTAAFGGRGGISLTGDGWLESESVTDLGFTVKGGAWYAVFRPAAVADAKSRINMGVFGVTPDGVRRTGLFYVFDNRGETLQGWTLGDSCNVAAVSGTMVFRGLHPPARTWKGVLYVGNFCGYAWAKGFNGQIAELRFYERMPTPAEDAAIVDELTCKWNAAKVLPEVLPRFKGFESCETLPHVRWTKVISGEADRYCGWPTVIALGGDELAATFSGDRSSHVCPWGRVKLVRSSDGGENWSPSVDVANSLLDDRDAGLLKLTNGDCVVFWFTSVAFTSPEILKTNPDWSRHYEKLSPGLVRQELGSFSLRSRDGGRTWGDKARLPTSTPHGAIQLSDGRLLIAGNSGAWVRGHLADDPEERTGDGKDMRRIVVAESADAGRSWRQIATIPFDEAPGGLLCEPCLIEGQDGTIRCYIRNINLAYSESRDGGRTWTAVRGTDLKCWDSPAHVTRLRDGRTLMTCARRVGWSVPEKDAGGMRPCVYALVGDENGSLASFEGAKEIPVYFTGDSDMGYATTAQTADGSLVTVLYAHHFGGPAQIVAVRWDLSGAASSVDEGRAGQ